MIVLSWRDYTLCRGLDEVAKLPGKQHPMFERYEASESYAKAIDEMCQACPVRKQCLSEALNNKESGCWAGLYLHNGEVDPAKNEHKTESQWEEIGDLYA